MADGESNVAMGSTAEESVRTEEVSWIGGETSSRIYNLPKI